MDSGTTGGTAGGISDGIGSRRAVLKLLVFGLAAASVPAWAAPLVSSPGAIPAGGLLHPIQPGQEIGLGWRLLELHPPDDGAIRLLLGHEDGAVAKVDLVLREGAARGPASTDLLDFLVMDGTPEAGAGQQPARESLGRALRRLAAIAQQNGAALDPAALATYRERREWAAQDAGTARTAPV